MNKSLARLQTKEAWYGWREKTFAPFRDAVNQKIESCKKVGFIA
jgi:hypothetical protein